MEQGTLTKEQIDAITEKARNSVRSAITEASEAPDSDPAELLSSVYREAE
jgi:TPP-dependent pyruvate/acetoin dehydrogenase alpha subunit